MLFARNSGRALPEQLQVISDASNSADYRPLFELSVAGLWSLFGLNPIAHHTVNLLLHALNAVLVTALGQRLARDPSVALLAGLSFAVLGCHTEAVLWMAARHEMMVTVLALLSMLSYIEFRSSGRRIWWGSAFVLYSVSFGFKETVLALPLLLALYDFLFVFPAQEGRWRRALTARKQIPWVSFFVVGGGYLVFRLIVSGGYDVRLTLIGPPKNMVYYVLMEVVALPDSTGRLTRFSLVTLPVMVSLAIAYALGGWFARDEILRNRAVWFGGLWMVFSLAPVILIVTERTTYFSSVGWALVTGTILALAWEAATRKNRAWQRRLVVLVIVLVLGANLVTLVHRSYWWGRAANVSYDVLAEVRDFIEDQPPESREFWFVDFPARIEYAYAFGSRMLFAAWLLQKDAGADGVLLSFLNSQPRSGALDERIEQLYSERGAETGVVAFVWQEGEVVVFRLPEKHRLP
jgi:hypothetical protein